MSTATAQKKAYQRPKDLRERRTWKHLFRYTSGQEDHEGYDGEDEKRKAPVTWESVHRFWKFVYPHRHMAYLLMFVTLFNQAAIVVMPVAVGRVLDSVLPRNDANLLNIVALGLIAFVMLRAFYLFVSRNLMMLIGTMVVRDVRMKLHTHLQRMSLRFLEDYQVGRIVSRIISDTQAIAQLLNGGIINTLANCLRLFFVAGTLLWIDWQLTLISCFTMPFFMVGVMRYIRQLKPAHKELAEDRSRLFAKAAETFSGMRVVKTYGTENRENLTFTKRLHLMLRKGMLMKSMHYNMLVIWEVSTWTGLVAMLWFGGHRVMAGGMSIGELVAFYGLLGLLFQPIAELINVSESVQAAMASLERVGEIMDEKPEIADHPEAVDAGVLTGEVVYQNVSFQYKEKEVKRTKKDHRPWANEEKKEKPVTLQGINLTVRPGECVAFVGPSGAGKSTITNLLARFYDVDGGSIKVDGVDIRDYTLNSYRRNMAIVLQDNFLFRGTIRENIAYARPDASDEDIIRAARMAGAWEFISEGEKGLDTVCGERGVKLSGGQKQRLSIARAILADPRILILDEATSALDSQAEAQIQDALDKLMMGRTTFIIAHRLSTIVHADKIVVMDHGQIVEVGTHDELLKRRGKYFDLFMEQYGKVQFSGETAEAIMDWRTKALEQKKRDDELSHVAEKVNALPPDETVVIDLQGPLFQAENGDRDALRNGEYKNDTPAKRRARLRRRSSEDPRDGYLSGRYMPAPAD